MQFSKHLPQGTTNWSSYTAPSIFPKLRGEKQKKTSCWKMPYVHSGKCPHLKKTIPFLAKASPLTSPPVDPVVSNSCGMCCHGPRCDERFHPTTIPDPLLLFLIWVGRKKIHLWTRFGMMKKNHWCMNRSKEFAYISMVWLGVVHRIISNPNNLEPGKKSLQIWKKQHP